MTRDDLLELLLVERHAPLPRPPETSRRLADMPAMAVDVDDSDIATARRRRELYEALSGVEVDEFTTAAGVVPASFHEEMGA